MLRVPIRKQQCYNVQMNMNILGSSPKKVCHKDRATDGKHKIFSIGSLLTDESSVKFISIYVRGIFG